jgi:hypothetical protein
MSANIEERFEGMVKRLERAENANRAMKIWGSIAFAGLMVLGSGPFASNATAKKQPPAIVTATQEIDLASGGKTVASLRMVSGKPNLVFFDSAGKTVVDVGINGATLPTGHSAGISVLDGNEDIPGTGKIRAGFGVVPSGPSAGVGEGASDGNVWCDRQLAPRWTVLSLTVSYTTRRVWRGPGWNTIRALTSTVHSAMTPAVTIARQRDPALTVLTAEASSPTRQVSFVTKPSTFPPAILTGPKATTELVTHFRQWAISWSTTHRT